MKRLRRIWRHFNIGTLAVRRAFPESALHAIERATREAEAKHTGEIRFAIEDSLPFLRLWRQVTPRQRAVEVFAQLGVWDTRDNNGVLIYVLLADHQVEIVADRGVGGGRVPQSEWDACCRAMEQHFRRGDFETGAVTGVRAVGALIARHFPAGDRNELPDRPVML